MSLPYLIAIDKKVKENKRMENIYKNANLMNLDTSFIIGKGRIDESYGSFIEACGFIGPVRNGACKLFDIPNLGKNKIAIGECNGFVFIGHHEIPLWFNDEELSSRDYHQFYKKITQTFKKGRYISAVFISKIIAFGYAIYDQGTRQRRVLGKYDVLMEHEGNIQVEETLISKRPDQSDTVYTFQGEDVELHKIGTQVTIDVLNNYCGQNFIMDDLVFKVYVVGPDLKKFYFR